jgi:hypothetical protein
MGVAGCRMPAALPAQVDLSETEAATRLHDLALVAICVLQQLQCAEKLSWRELRLE